MLSEHIALVSQSVQPDTSDLMRIAAAIQKQVVRDLSPLWQVTATVDAYKRLDDVPSDYWRVVIRDDIDLPGVQGVHWTQDRQPFALVLSSNSLDRISHRVSHEVLEMLIDPSGDRLVAGASPHPAQGRVNFLVEICDPTQAAANAYTVNDIVVADFVTPSYFDPIAASGGRYAYGGRITAPRQILPGGYLSWIDPLTDRLWQVEHGDGGLAFHDRGPYDPNLPIRFQSDRVMSMAARSADYSGVRDNGLAGEHGPTATFARRGRALQREIDHLIGTAKAGEEDAGGGQRAPSADTAKVHRSRRRPRA